ncbi:MAG: hypothetical protein WC220_10795 [Pedobacter sp.]|jgi:hypothetical protein
MKIISQVKAGVKDTPALLIFSYLLFVGLDLYTTYLASPDLGYEDNWIIRYFQFSFIETIILAIIFALLLSLGFVIAMNYIKKIPGIINIKVRYPVIYTIFQSKWLFLSFFVVVSFYSHFFYSAFVSCNNYLHYIYIFKIENVFEGISSWYINKVIISFPFFFIFCHIFFILVAILYTVSKVKRIERKILKASPVKDSL